MSRKPLLRLTITTLVLVLAASAAEAQLSLAQSLSGCNGAAPLNTIQADPSNYQSRISGLVAGDRLQLAAGTYDYGIDLGNKNGEPGKCIVIEGPASGPPALFRGSSSRNLISLQDSSYITLRNLSLDGQHTAGDGIKAESTAASVHHILVERLSLQNFDAYQDVVGINTKCPAWNWVVRLTTITSTGTGMYFGNSDGSEDFSNSLVEHNLVYATLGYNAQFKHQLSRSTSIGAPSSGTTIIRHNTFSKQTGSGSSEFRPNLLVGHWPLSGAGSSDIYQIYGNLFYQNPTEALFQGEGNVALHDNLFVNSAGTNRMAVNFQAHNSVPRRVDAFNNTVVATGTGISITGADTANYDQRVIGNAVFAATPLVGGDPAPSNNVTGSYSAASTYLNNPTGSLGSGLDLYPKAGQLLGSATSYSAITGLLERDLDFNKLSRIATYRGAYSGDGVNPGWTPALAIKPEPTCTSIADVEPNDSMSTPQVISGSCNQISGTFLNDSSTGPYELDYYRVSVPAGRTVAALLDGLTQDYSLEIYDAAGNYAAYSYNNGTAPEQASFTNTTASAANVFVVVYRSSAVPRANYQLRVSYDPACNSITDVEPNDSTSAPQVLSGGCNQIWGTFLNDSSTGPYELDYFRVSLPAGSTVTALLNGLTQDYSLEIYDAAGSYVGWSYNNGTTPERASWTNTTASAMNVFILAYRSSAVPRANYQLRVSY
jgi:hypothetical protein